MPTNDQNEIDPEIGTVWTKYERRFEKSKLQIRSKEMSQIKADTEELHNW